VNVSGEQWTWTTSRVSWTRRNIFNKSRPCQRIYFLTYFVDVEEYTLTQWNFFHMTKVSTWPSHVVFSGLRHPVEGSTFDFWWGLMWRFANIFCDCWNKYNCFNLKSCFDVCKCYMYWTACMGLTSFMMIINTQIESTPTNMSLDAYVCNFKLFSINNVVFYVKLEVNNQRNLV
jgi:hypothetical protein